MLQDKSFSMDYTLSKEEINNILKNYNLGELISYSKLSGGSINLLTKIKTTKGIYVIKIFLELENKYYLNYEIDLLNQLSKSNILVPKIIESNKGHTSKFKRNITIIMTFIEGNHSYKVTSSLLREMGSLLGRFHKQIQNYKPKYSDKVDVNLSPKILYDRYNKLLKTYPYKNIKVDLKEKIHLLKDLSFEELPKGAIHNDFHQYNILFKKNKIQGLIDFQSFFGPLIYDISSAIVRFCFEKDGRLNKNKVETILKEYEKYRPLSKKEKEAMKKAILFNILYVIDYFIPKGRKMPKDYFQELKWYFKMFEFVENKELNNYF